MAHVYNPNSTKILNGNNENQGNDLEWEKNKKNTSERGKDHDEYYQQIYIDVSRETMELNGDCIVPDVNKQSLVHHGSPTTHSRGDILKKYIKE